MADGPTQDGKRVDSMDPWRGVRDIYMDAWAKTMVEMVNSEAYAQANGTLLDTYLTVSAPFREAVEKVMLKALEQLAMPSRSDFVSIAERITNIEMKLDDLDAKLDLLHALLNIPVPPARTSARKPQPPSRKTAKTNSSKRGKK